jgi:Zn-dependent metalloprotease
MQIGQPGCAREVFDGLGAIWDFFHRVYGCNSIDRRGFPLNATVHFGTCFHNAMSNGDQIVMGDGDGRTFKRFTTIDVIAHEGTHGMVQMNTSIGYSGEAGAVNESLADVVGSLVKQYHLG